MFSNVIILTITVVAVYSHEYHQHQHHHHPSSLRNTLLQREHAKEQNLHPYHHIRVQPEPSSSEEYKYPEVYQQQYAQNFHQQGQESHEANDHVAPVYQHVDEQNQEYNVHQEAAIKHKYQTVQYPVPAQHEFKIHVPSHEAQPQPQYQQDTHEEVAYHHSVPHHEAASHESHDEPIDYYAYPKYQYEYKVEDPHTGDNKFQHEMRDGDVVKGVYGLHEADGSIRTVEYSSDKHHGFSAIVKHSAPGQHVHIESHHPN